MEKIIDSSKIRSESLGRELVILGSSNSFVNHSRNS